MHPHPQLVWRAQLGLAGALILLIVGVVVITASRPAPPTPAPVPPEPDIRVRLMRAAAEIGLDSPDVIQVGTEGDLRPMPTPARLRIVDDNWVASSVEGPVTIAQRDQIVVVEAEGPATVRGRGVLDGRLLLIVRSDDPTRFDAVGVLDMEPYVAGVVSAETYDGWGLEALKAQGVAARSYAISERNRARGTRRSYDIDAGHSAQTVNLEPRDDAVLAAQSTRGVVLTWEDSVLRAYYSSTCGGRPASASDNWAGTYNEAAPLQAHPRSAHCQASPLFLWQINRPVRTLGRRLVAWGRERGHPIAELGVPVSIEIDEVNDAGRPVRYVVKDRRGQAIRIGAESMRLACNQRVDGERPDKPVHSNDLTFTIRGGTVTIDGRGFGHGVGLCQFGAAELDQTGKNWQHMLELYYPGATLERAYE